MSLKVVNRLPELEQALLQVADPDLHQRLMMQAADRAGPPVLRLLKATAPVGREEPEIRLASGKVIHHERPSKRQHGITLEKGWLPIRATEADGGARLVIESRAPHMAPLLSGKPEREITARRVERLIFHWFKEGRAFFGKRVTHPKVPRATFVNEAMGDVGGLGGRRLIQKEVAGAARLVFEPIREFFT